VVKALPYIAENVPKYSLLRLNSWCTPIVVAKLAAAEIIVQPIGVCGDEAKSKSPASVKMRGF
jgi:hypothetical protein